MKKLFFCFLYVCIVLLTATSCNEDSFNTVVDIDIPEHKPTPVMSLNMNTGDTSISVLLNKSRALMDSSLPEYIEDASIRIYKNETLWQEPIFDDTQSRYIVENMDAIEEDEATYRVEVDIPGFDQLTATQTIPNAAVLKNLTLGENTTFDALGAIAHDITFEIEDNANTEDYYLFKMYVLRTDTNTGNRNKILLLSEAIGSVTENGYGGTILSDEVFNGQTFKVRAPVPKEAFEEFLPGDILKVEMKALTRDNFLYDRTLALYEVNKGNPFAEPVVVHNNINNGYGIFRMGIGSELLLEF